MIVRRHYMAYFIGAILLILTLITVGLIFRKRVYDAVDRYESWKMDIINRNTASELARIKQLNLSGETKKKFESWKERWEHIVAKEMPDIEEYLFDAEDAADRYRFPSAKKSLKKIEQMLISIEDDIEEILQELDDLLKSEKTSRVEIKELEPNIQRFRKILSQGRYQYGKAENRFEKELDDFEKELDNYFELVEDGNYIKGRQLVDELKSDLEAFEEEFIEFPDLLTTCKTRLPSRLDELASGVKVMKEDGYRIEHLNFVTDIQNYQERLLDCIKSLEKGNISEVKVIISETEENINEMYDQLEKEAIDKNYFEAQFPTYEQTIGELKSTFSNTKTEVEQLRETYYFEDSDMEQFLTLENTITQIKSQLDELTNDVMNENTSHSELRVRLESGFKQLKELQHSHEEFKTRIYNLRKDELEAKENLQQMNEQISHIKRKIRQSNIPGVPNFIWDSIENASNSNKRVIKVLDKQPLDITEVQHALSEAKDAVDHAFDQTNLMIEHANLTEQVIQYANRYRSQYPLLAAQLSESERLFRSYEYELALEHAARAVEEIEPGVLSRLEVYQEA